MNYFDNKNNFLRIISFVISTEERNLFALIISKDFSVINSFEMTSKKYG